MTEYRRFYVPNSTWFFTVNLGERKNNNLLTENIDKPREAFRYVKQRKPFNIEAVVIMPDHLHCLWTLPDNDIDYSTRWNMIKGTILEILLKAKGFQRAEKYEMKEAWQRRFWVHTIDIVIIFIGIP